MTLPTTSESVWTIKTGWFSGHGCDRIYNLPTVSGPEVAEPVKVVPAAELVEALTHVRKLGEDLIEVHEALAMALYHAENLRRYIDRVPVRDLAESEAGFEKAKHLSEAWNG